MPKTKNGKPDAPASRRILCLLGVNFRSECESADERASSVSPVPSHAQPLAVESLVQRVGRGRAAQAHERRVIYELVPADVVVRAEAACLDARHVSCLELHAARASSFAHVKADRRFLDADHVLKQVAGHGTRKISKRLLLPAGRSLVHDQDRFGRIGIMIWVTQGGARLHHSHQGQAVELDTLPTAFLDSPRQNGLVARQPDFRVGEARAGVNVRASHLNVISADRGAQRHGCQENQGQSRNACGQFPPHGLFLLTLGFPPTEASSFYTNRQQQDNPERVSRWRRFSKNRYEGLWRSAYYSD